MQLQGIVNQNAEFWYFQTKTLKISQIGLSRMGNSYPPGEGKRCMGQKKWYSPHLYTGSWWVISLWDSLALLWPETSDLGVFRQPQDEFPCKEPWIPNNISPARSTHIPEPQVRTWSHWENSGGAWLSYPAQTGHPVFSHQTGQHKFIPHGPPEGD